VADTRRRGFVVTRRPPRPKYRRGAPGAGAGACRSPPAYFNEAQAEQALWQEFRDHGASLNNVLNEALQIHAGPTWQIFKVHALVVEFEIFPCRFRAHAFSDPAFFRVSFTIDKSLRVVLNRGITASIS
jgi:hypothetical protein